jgi:protein-S-isoprenylcysteine O-methyltransferase Ste14
LGRRIFRRLRDLHGHSGSLRPADPGPGTNASPGGRTGKSTARDRNSVGLLWFADYRQPAFIPPIGVAFMVVAIWLFWRSHADLGLNWSPTLEIRKDHQLVTGGVYRRIRHPMYASIILFSTAQALLLPNWLAGFSALVPFALLYFIRTPREEQMMCNIFGDEYRTYMQRTRRLIPRLW